MKKVRLQLLVGFLFVLVTSCSKNPFTDPYAFAPSGSNKVWQPSSKESTKLADIDPLEKLQIPSEEDCIPLGDLFDIALNNSPETKLSWEEARESAAGYSSSLSKYLPEVSFDANYTASKRGYVIQGQYVKSEAQQWGPELNISYLLWDSGKRRYKTEKAFQFLQQSNFMHNEEIQNVMLNVATSYYEVLYAKALLTAYESDLLNSEQTYKAAQEKGLSGIFDETDLMQAKTNYLKSKVSVTTQIATVKNDFIDLLSTLGIPANISFHLGTFPEDEPTDPNISSVNELIEVAKALRPDLLASKAEIMAVEADLKEKIAELLPDVNFSGQGGNQWYSDGSNDRGNYTLQLNLTFPIFTGFYHLNKIKQAEAELEKTVASYREAELKVLKMVKRSYNNFIMAKQQIVDTFEYLEAANVEYTAMFERYKFGIVDILDLLSSEASLSDARAQYANSQKIYYVAIIDIAFSTGMLTNSCPWNIEETE